LRIFTSRSTGAPSAGGNSSPPTEHAIARIYRPGQTQHVTIHVCVAAATVDEMKRDRVIGKMRAQEAFKRHLERV
jgi:hypothetical protein